MLMSFTMVLTARIYPPLVSPWGRHNALEAFAPVLGFLKMEFGVQ